MHATQTLALAAVLASDSLQAIADTDNPPEDEVVTGMRSRMASVAQHFSAGFDTGLLCGDAEVMSEIEKYHEKRRAMELTGLLPAATTEQIGAACEQLGFACVEIQKYAVRAADEPPSERLRGKALTCIQWLFHGHVDGSAPIGVVSEVCSFWW